MTTETNNIDHLKTDNLNDNRNNESDNRNNKVIT